MLQRDFIETGQVAGTIARNDDYDTLGLNYGMVQ